MKRCLSQRRNAHTARIEVVPLIDIVFFLLIFYIVSARFDQENAVNINRPQSRSAVATTDQSLSVALTKGGSMHVGGRALQIGDKNALMRCMEQSGTKNVLVYADRDVSTGLLLRVMDACREAGATSVNVAAVAKR